MKITQTQIHRTDNFCGIVIPTEKDNILDFNKYLKSDQIPYIIFADIESLIKKNIDVQTIKTFLNNKKQVSIFSVDIPCQLYRLFTMNKTSVFYILGKIV